MKTRARARVYVYVDGIFEIVPY